MKKRRKDRLFSQAHVSQLLPLLSHTGRALSKQETGVQLVPSARGTRERERESRQRSGYTTQLVRRSERVFFLCLLTCVIMATSTVVAASTTMGLAARHVSSAPRRAAAATTIAGALPRSRDVIALAPGRRRLPQNTRGVVRSGRHAGRSGNNSHNNTHNDVAPPRAAILSNDYAPTADASASKKKDKKKLRLRISDVWYDCTGWAKAHPGGSLFISLMDGCDATDVFFALHSYGRVGTLSIPGGVRFSFPGYAVR